MHSVTRLDRIRNKYIRGSLGVTNIAGKVRENKLKWFGHVERRNVDDIVDVNGIQTI